MKNLNFLRDDKNFLDFLKHKEKEWGEYSVLPKLNKILENYSIHLPNIFFLKNYLETSENTDFLNPYFLTLFNEAVYLNERESFLYDLVINKYDKEKLCHIVFNELKKNYDGYSDEEIESYKWSLCDILYTIGEKKYEKEYIDFLLDSSLAGARDMLIQLLKKIKCKNRNEIFDYLKSTDKYYKDYKFF